MSEEQSAWLQDLLALREATPEAAAASLGSGLEIAQDGQSYGQLQRLRSLKPPARPGIRLFWDEDTAKIALIYAGGASFPRGLTEDVLRAATDDAKVEALRSRQGRRGQMHVAAEAGLAWSELDGEIGWVEVFPPMSFAEYRDSIYVEPPAFNQ